MLVLLSNHFKSKVPAVPVNLYYTLTDYKITVTFIAKRTVKLISDAL